MAAHDGDNGGDRNAAAALLAGAAAAAGIFAQGGDVAAAAAAAGNAATAAELAAGADAASAAAAGAAAAEAVKSDPKNNDEETEEDQSLSLESKSKTPATSTPATGTPATTTPATLATTAPVNTTAPTTLPATTTPASLASNGTMTAQTASKTCTACATCPGFEFGAKWPDLGSTTSWAGADTDDEDDWDADIDDDEFSPEDADGEEGDVPESEELSRRALAGLFYDAARKNHQLIKRVVGARKSTVLAGCPGFTQFVNKPPYYNAKNVAAFEAKPLTMDADDKASMNALIRWVIPIRTPPGDCTTVPRWELLRTEQCVGDAPLPDGSTFSKVVGVGEQVWQVGGAPNKVNINREVNIDHVYEAKYLDDFFEDLKVNQGFTCQNLKDVWDSTDGSTLTNLFLNLPSKANKELKKPANPEFIGMSKGLNMLKEAVTNKLWNKNLPLSWVKFGQKDPVTKQRGPDITLGLAFTITGKDAEGNEVSFDPANDLEELTTAAQILDLMNTPDAIAYMSAPNDRIYAALQAYGVPCQGGQSWAERYKSYLLNRFATRNVQIKDLYTRIFAEIGTSYRAEYVKAWRGVYPLERMQLPPPTSWASDLPAIQQAIQAKFDGNPASLDKRQAAPPAMGQCIFNANTTVGGASLSVPGRSGLMGRPTSAPGRPGLMGGLSSVSPNGSTTASVKTSAALTSTPVHPSASSSAPTLVTPIATTPGDPIVVPPATAPASTAATAVPSSGDPCGPTAAQGNPNYPDTCNATVQLTPTPATYGVYCPSAASTTSVDWESCETAYKATCAGIRLKEYPKGAWVWSDAGAGCAVGVWMPTDPAASAMTPSLTRCQDLIFGAMVRSCDDTTTSALASVNLNAVPSFSDATTRTGVQVDVGYPSYVIAPQAPRGLRALRGGFGWSTARLGEGVGVNANNQYGTSGITDSQHQGQDPGSTGAGAGAINF